jgi:hypothetical protein
MTRTHALALLSGAREAHMHPAVADMIAAAIRRHPDECNGTGRHLLGLAECEAYRRALVVLGIGGAA